MSRLSDISLATQVAVFGNKRAFDQLVRQYHSPVRRFFLTQTLGDEMLSDDLAQDTFIKAYTHISQYRGTSGFLTWLTRIAYNVWYDYCRSDKEALRMDDAIKNSAFARTGAESGSPLSVDLLTALAQLRDDERTCITLQLIDGYQIDEISEISRMPAGTVKSHLKRGKEKMANFLRQNGYDR